MLLRLVLFLPELLSERNDLINSYLLLTYLWFRGSLRFCCLGSLLFLLLFRGPCLLFGVLLRGALPKIGLMAGPLDSVSGTREFEGAKAFSYVFLDMQYTYAP